MINFILEMIKVSRTKKGTEILIKITIPNTTSESK